MQFAVLVAFLWLFRHTEYSGAQEISPLGHLFFHLDPLAVLAPMISARQIIPPLLPAVFVVVLTMILGRFFCGWICPLGTLLDYFHRLIHPIARYIKISRVLTAPGNAAKYVILFAVLLAAVFAFPLVGWVDPFAILVRGLTFSVDPMLYRAAGTVEPLARWHLLPFGPTEYQWAWLSGAILLGVFALEFVGRRFWCRYLCPTGALLGLCAHRPLLRRVPPKVCKSCDTCSTICRMDALDPAAGFSPERCNLCMDCIKACPQGMVKFTWKGAKRQPRPVDLSRRGALVGLALGAAIPGAAAVARAAHPKQVDPRLLRPPGAADEKTFMNLCIRCGECMKVCPTNCLQPCVLESGVEGIFSPRVAPRYVYNESAGEYAPCCEYTCTLCGQVCPTGAIPRLDESDKHKHPIGKAYFDHGRCLPWAENTPCIRCEEMCPTPDKAIKIRKTFTIQGKDGRPVEIQRPYVDRDLCVGCGNCESTCPLKGQPGIRVYRTDAPDPGTECHGQQRRRRRHHHKEP